MYSFKRALLGYRRSEVDAAINSCAENRTGLERRFAALEDENATLEAQSLIQARLIAAGEADVTALSAMVIERERTIRDLNVRLEEAHAIHDRSITSLDAVSARLEELQAQARGQATRIRMKALREAVEVSRKVQQLDEVQRDAVTAPEPEASAEPAAPATPDIAAEATAVEEAVAGTAPTPLEPGTSWTPGLYEGDVRLEIGPLGDFSQLVGFEETVGSLGATDISVERFSEGRATFSMRLDHPVDLLSELESHSSIDFKVRHTAPDNLILDVDED
jgi:hypothetical protein